eukprot:1159080-Pelagomonas_calceolata.AAC.13
MQLYRDGTDAAAEFEITGLPTNNDQPRFWRASFAPLRPSFTFPLQDAGACLLKVTSLAFFLLAWYPYGKPSHPFLLPCTLQEMLLTDFY